MEKRVRFKSAWLPWLLVAPQMAVVGVFSFEIAETKVAQVMDFARRHQHPLQCTMEKE